LKNNNNRKDNLKLEKNIKRKDKLRFKDVFILHKNKRFNEIIGIESENAALISNPKKIIKENKYIIIITSIIVIALLLSTMYNDIITFFITLLFLFGICLIVTVFNAFKFVCSKEGITISFGFQKVFFPYEKIKCIYISKYNDYSFLHLVKDYNIVIKYVDTNGIIKELSFSTLFVSPEETNEFINNFKVDERISEEEVKFEKFKIIKRILKIALFALFIMAIIVYYSLGR